MDSPTLDAKIYKYLGLIYTTYGIDKSNVKLINIKN